MKTFKLTILSLLISSILAGCNQQQVQQPVLTDTASVITAASDKTLSKTYVEQGFNIIEQYPEAGRAFLEWKAESPEALDFKQELAKKLLAAPVKNSPKRDELLKVLAEKPAFSGQGYKPINFDTDQGNHMNKLSEWWYYNGHLNTPESGKYGYEACFFRVGFIYFAHIAVTDENNQKFYFDRVFYPPGKAKIAKGRNTMNYGNSGVEQTGDFTYKLKAEVDRFKLDLNLELKKKPLIINGNGLIDMPEGGNSYYYSLTSLKTSGTLEVSGKKHKVEGMSWMDHQWGNFIAKFIGWDWFALQFDDNTEYNLAASRYKNGVSKHFYVNILDSQGKGFHNNQFGIKRLDWWKSPHTGKLFATKWEINIPARNEVIIVEANVKDQEVFHRKAYDLPPDYWEGSCTISKRLPDGRVIKGRGYAEQFPYGFQIP